MRRDAGTDPVSLLSQKAKVLRFGRLPSDAGMLPSRALLLRSRILRAVSLLSGARPPALVPLMSYPLRFRAVTLPLLIVTPVQTDICILLILSG